MIQSPFELDAINDGENNNGGSIDNMDYLRLLDLAKRRDQQG